MYSTVCINTRYVRSNLVVVVFFIVKSESKILPGNDLAAEDMKEMFERYSFIYPQIFE